MFVTKFILFIFLLLLNKINGIYPSKVANQYCFYLSNFEENIYNYITLDNKITSKHIEDRNYANFKTKNQILFVKNVLVFMSDTGTESVDNLHFDNFERLFVHFDIYSYDWNKGFLDFSTHTNDYVHFYENKYQISYNLVSVLSLSITSIYSDGNSVIWSELNIDTNRQRIYLFDLKKEVLTGYFNDFNMNDDIDYLEPVIQGKYVMYLEYNNLNSESTVVLYNLNTKSDLRLKSSSSDFKTFHAQITPKNTISYYIDYTRMNEAYAMWLTTKNDVKVVDGQVILSDNTDTVKSEIYIQLLELPSLVRTKISPNEYVSGDYTVLEDASIGGDTIFLLLKKPSSQNYLIKYYRIKEHEYVDYIEIEYPVEFEDTSVNILLYKVNNDGIHYYILHVATEDVEKMSNSVCEVENALLENAKAAFIYSDLLFWLTSTGNHNEYSVHYIDFDKDNDGVIDAYDLFPEDGSFKFDSDNDGIGDSSDIWPATGDCTQDPNDKCGSDYLYLYIIWCVFTFIASVFTVVVIIRIKKVRNSNTKSHVQQDSVLDTLQPEKYYILYLEFLYYQYHLIYLKQI